jgi:hypothetical protein
MRSLRPDIETVEDKLPQLQKVGDELAANFGDRSDCIASTLLPGEAAVTEMKVLSGRST